MDLFLFNHDEYNRLYNCSYDVNSIPLDERRRPILGYTLIALGVMAELAYIPCCFVLWNPKMRDNSSCYKFMMMLSIVDVFSIPVVAIVTGTLGVMGAVFCTAPSFIYICGAIIMGTWIFNSLMATLLAISRCIAILHGNLMQKLFSGNKPYFWAIPAFLYSAYFTLYTRTPVFTAFGFSWFFNPHHNYIEDITSQFHNVEHAYHNLSICFLTIGLYAFFALAMLKKWNDAEFKQTKTQKRVFMQVFMISFCTCIATSTYVFMNFPFAPEFLSVASSFTYFGIHGIPPLIYFCLNESVQRRIKRMFNSNVVSVNAIEVAT
uniref:Serpentine Receptor, class T n=1 Tax=Panagrellus redivivus TaxID=6233 RepID=A0A7E4VF78_PANRE